MPNENLFQEGIDEKTMFFSGLKAVVWHAGGGIVRVKFSTRQWPKRIFKAYAKARKAFPKYEVRPNWVKNKEKRS